MLSPFPRRSARRPVLLVFALASIVFIAGLLRDASSDGGPPRARVRTASNATTTVTLIHTVYAETTHTVTVATQPPSTSVTAPEVPVSNENHLFRPDGLLEVNPNAPHPIYRLIANAEQQWTRKLQKASKTLKEAVAEYERRYHRKPPVGFDAWWTYVKQHDVQLPDEYDQIHHDLEPFWGMDPRDLRAIQAEWETHEDSYTVGKDTSDAPIDVLDFALGGDRPDEKSHLINPGFEIIELLEDVQDYIPPFRAVFSPHDNPNLLTDWELREMAVKAAAEGKFIDINNPPEVKLHGWPSACPPTSKAWTDPPPSPFSPNTASPPPPPKRPKTFIHDHKLAMDPCLHPQLITSHGQFLAHKKGPIPHRKLIPQFSYSPTILHHDITPAMPINWVPDVHPREFDLEWKDKVDERLLWRGRNTGIWHDGKGTGKEGDGNGVPWLLAQRDRLVSFANEDFHEFVDVISPTSPRESKPPPLKTYKKSHLFPSLFDIAFTDKPINCPPPTCDFLTKKYEFRPIQDLQSAGKYKYVMDVDGNGWSSRFKRLITSNSLVFKATVYPEWWLDRIQPWVHYVPVQNDYSDLVDVVVFFTGEPGKPASGPGLDTEGGGSENEALARKVAKAGREWSLRYWRKEDLTAYFFRLFLEYARVMSLERDKMGFVYSGEV